MATPILSSITSINALLKGQSWAYQPVVTSGGPATVWTASTLPPGITINASTGLLSGTPTQAGVFNVSIVASDSTAHASAALIFPIGVESTINEHDGAVQLNVDLQSGILSGSAGSDYPLYAKSGDKVLVSIGFINAGQLVAIPGLSALRLRWKAYDDEGPLVELNDGSYAGSGDGYSTRYLVTLDFSSPVLLEALNEEERPDGTGLVALAELEWAWTPIGGTAHTRTSRSFSCTTIRALA